jgi:Cu/Zn superoxide dismutase
MEGNFKVSDVDVGLVTAGTAFETPGQETTYEFKDTLYSRAAMSNALVGSCGDAAMGSVSAPSSGDYAYKTVMLTGPDGHACGTLIPEDAVYSYVRVNGADGAAIVFYDTVNGVLLSNYAGASFDVSASDCTSPSYTNHVNDVWTDSNSWKATQVGTGIMSVQLHGVCYDLSMNLPAFATSNEFGFMAERYSIKFNQPTPFHHTVMTMVATMSSTDIGKFHVHHHATMGQACSATGGHYNPLNVDLVTDYGLGMQDSFEVGDLSGKHGKWDTLGFSVGAMDEETIAVNDANLPLWGMDSIAGRSIVFHAQDGSRKGCSNIGLANSMEGMIPEETRGHVDFVGELSGSMSFRQLKDSPNSPTVIKSTLKFSDSRADVTEHKYHVHTLYDFSHSNGDCNNNGGHYHPTTGVPCLTPNLAGDVCEIGDLNNKLGKLVLTGADTVLTQTDNWLPLSGDYSILWKSITIHNVDGSRMSCGGIKKGGQSLSAFFDKGSNVNFIPGSFMLSTNSMNTLNGVTEEMRMWSYVDSSTVQDSTIEYYPNYASLTPNFGIAQALSGNECSSLAAGIESNLGASAIDNTHGELAWTQIRITHPNGDKVCAVLIPDNSKLQMIRHIGASGSGMLFNDVNNGIGFHNYHNGDLTWYTDVDCTTEHPVNTLNIPAFSTDQAPNTFHRSFWPESRAVKIGDECVAFKTENLPQYTVVDQLSVDSGTVDILFQQPTPFHPVVMTVTRNQAFIDANPIGKMHIHEFNVGTEMDCSAQGGLYQDLSGRHGYMNTWGSDEVMTFEDGSFTTWGLEAINARTVNLHDVNTAAGIACGEVGLQCASSTMKPPVNTAFVPFTGAVIGYIKLTQNSMDEFSPTVVRASLKVNEEVYGSTLTGTDHKFHIHTTHYQSASTTANCVNTGGHYNPQDGVPCPIGNCEVGDLSNKHGLLTFDLSGSNFQFNDMTLPLNGTFSVMDRSIVIHEPVTGARQACGPTDPQPDMTARLNVAEAAQEDMARSTLSAVLSHRGITELPSGIARKRRSVDDVISAIDDHGCWCPKFAGDQALFGVPVDELDNVCRAHSKCSHCEKFVTCEGNLASSYDILVNDEGDYECVDMDECTKNRCMCDVEFAVTVANYLAAGSVVDPAQANLNSASCPRNAGGATGSWAADSCCGSSPNWMPYDSNSSTCVDGSLQ